MSLKPEELKEHGKNIEIGETAERFLESREWSELLKPLIDNMLLGLKDVTTIDVSIGTDIAVEVKARALAARYLERVEEFLRTQVESGIYSKQTIDVDMKTKKLPGSAPLYKIRK